MSLLELARTLGIVETVYTENALPASEQFFEKVIVIDFEATCWEKSNVKWKSPEIIEFPAVLRCLKTNRILSEFSQYVLPIESPRLSNFCTELTGITQEQVDNGVPLQTCLMLFDKWLKEMIKEHKLIFPKTTVSNKIGNCAFVTWSDWDLGICLHNECERKRIKKPVYFDSWVDLKAIYKEWYKHKPKNFADALKFVGMKFVGREHCGIDDARNISKLSCKLVQDGALLNITKDLRPFLWFAKQ